MHIFVIFTDETMKRLTILPDKLTEENRTAITKLYGNLIEELDSKHANEILVKSSPKDTKVCLDSLDQLKFFCALHT